MTILSKKKGSCTKNEVDNVDHNGSHSHPLSHPLSLPHTQLQNENINLSAERLFGADRPSPATLWSTQALPHSHNIVTTDKRTSQPHYDEYDHIDTSSTHGKRRHRVSPMRSSRSKHSRVDRDRTATSSPNGNATAGVSAVSESSATICNIPPPVSSDVGCNSEDEYENRPYAQLTEEEWLEREKRFEKKVMKKRLIIRKMHEDGACLFRAVADQVYGDQDMHMIVRKHCMDYIAANADYFSQYVTEDFDHYVTRKRLEHVHGNHIEIQAMSEMYNRTIEVFCYGTEPINIFHGTVKTDNEPIRLSYHRGVHYNSIVDPYKATVGVGLGLPGHCPGLADKNILKEAARQSEEIHIEQAMLEDKLRATDWEATNEAIEEQVARESYLQWLKDNERRNRAARSPTASSSSSTVTSSASSGEIRSPRPRAHGSNISPIGSPFRGEASYRNSPARLSPPPSIPSTSKTSASPAIANAISTAGASSLAPLASSNVVPSGSETFQLLETSSFMNQLPPEMFGLQDWDDTGILAQTTIIRNNRIFFTFNAELDPGVL
ncbi:unnamed protein product [Allacma fusca]|uniref:ubiquitinyl hydrolase 1 n=1 Tax=Allacma fusca TaxID=39272 RepID=A0A8J2KU55_9HEXA|nr:unnamed protein product [Allacma fusca]